MADYMTGYGADDARRESRWKLFFGVLLLIAAALLVWWMFLRNLQPERRLDEFVQALKSKDFPTAYTFWGCSQAAPCKDYTYQQFLEDWGPEGRYKDAGTGAVLRSGHTGSAARRFLLRFKPPDDCPESIIRVLRAGSENIPLLVNRADGVIGFSPWPVCNPRVRF
jgi:hypothetical protein